MVGTAKGREEERIKGEQRFKKCKHRGGKFRQG